MVCRVVAVAIEGATQTAGLHANCGVGARSALVGVGFAANQVTLDIEVAYLAGGPAQLLEQAKDKLALLLVWREIRKRKHGEQLKLGFDPARRSAQIVDCSLQRLGQAQPDRGLERGSNLAEVPDWERRLAGSSHGRWIPPPPNGRREIESIALEPAFLRADEEKAATDGRPPLLLIGICWNSCLRL
jgi:hypothetical protein